MNLKLHYKCGENRHALYKLLLVMKLIIILLTTAILQVSANTYAQTITLKKTNAPFEQIINEIRNQTGYDFFYSNDLLRVAKPISINITGATLEDALKQCFSNQPLTYTIAKKENAVVVKEKLPSFPERMVAAFADIRVGGRVVDEKGNPLPSATIRIKGNNFSVPVTTTESGGFSVLVPGEQAVLIVSYVGYKTKEVVVSGASVDLEIRLEPETSKLDEVTVVSTGYQNLPKERATGSIEKIDNALFNRMTGPDILPRLEGITTGLLFDKHEDGQARLSGLTIRGVSSLDKTLTRPLIVLDNFVYEGDLNNINPNDIESITVLKDAAAASIWGARAGNGVIVVTTKKGQFDQPTQLSFNSNVTIAGKPDLFSLRQMKTTDYIDIEKMLFSKGFYDSNISNIYTWPYLSPVVELLQKAKENPAFQSAADAQIDALRNQDVRNDFLKYVYDRPVSQQYALNISGGSKQFNYLLSGGYDRQERPKARFSNNRMTLNSGFTYRPLKDLDIQAGLRYTKITSHDVGVGPLSYSQSMAPYTRLADDQGNPLVVGRAYRSAFLDTVGSDGSLLDWKYRPLADIDASSQVINVNSLLLNAGASYKLSSVFSADVKYQYGETLSNNRNLKTQDSWYVRDFINQVTNVAGNALGRPVPLGGILDQSSGSAHSSNLRGQLNANKTWNEKHQLTAIAGAELQENRNASNSHRVYGYDENTAGYQNVDHLTRLNTRFYDRLYIPSSIDFFDEVHRFTSLYTNASYSYDGRYIVSGSARKDASNLFGVKTNQKGVPLWSAGLAWNISREHFYHSELLPELKLRATYGYAGNTNNNLSAFSVIRYLTSPNPFNGLPKAAIVNPTNKELRWEKVATKNLGLDFGFKDRRVTGSIEYYEKKTTDALSLIPIDQSTGFSSFTLNNAELKGKGVDFQLHSINLNGGLQWNTDFLFSYSANKVTRYVSTSVLSASGVLANSYSITPIIGKPVYTVFSYKWEGLDPENGDPRGLIDGEVSKDYAKIIAAKVEDLQYHGSAVPVYFGAFRNTFSWKSLSFSANISYKLGYYFRRSSILYGNLFGTANNAGFVGHADFYDRWQQPGDEKRTNVPSMIYPADANRDAFYQNSAALVSRADNIRLQDITLGYTLIKPEWYFKNIKLYANMANLGIIWRANKQGLDPDFGANYPNPLSLTFGLSTNF